MSLRFVTKSIHAYLDYPVAIGLIVMPFIFGLGAENFARRIAGHIAQHELHKGLRHGKALDHIADRLCFGPVRAQEFQPRRCGVEKIAQGHHRPPVQGRRFDR